MTLLSALEIAGNYPANILIEVTTNGKKWTSSMYMTREGSIHKLMLSFDNFPFDSKEAAEAQMRSVAEEAVKYVNSLDK